MTRSLARTLTFGLLAAMFSACGTTDGGDPSPDKLYAYVTSSSGVFAFSINASTGALTMVAGSPFAAGEASHSVAIDPSGKFAYVTDSYPDYISAFSIDQATGALTSVGTFEPHYYAESIAVHPSGRFVLVCATQGISVFETGAGTGALTLVPGSPFALGGYPTSIAVHPLGRFVYVTVPHDQPNGIYAFTIDPVSGVLEAVPGSPYYGGALPNNIAVEPSGKFLYVTDEDGLSLSASVSGFRVDATTGGLTEVGGSPFNVAYGPYSMASDPSGKFVFVASFAGDVTSGRLSVFGINSATGVLSAVPGSPFYGGSSPHKVAIDPSGKFVYVVNGDNISAFSINSGTGVLTRLAGWPFAEGVNANGIAVVRISQGTR